MALLILASTLGASLTALVGASAFIYGRYYERGMGDKVARVQARDQVPTDLQTTGRYTLPPEIFKQ